ncbi:MAG: hypothetical protein KJO24_04550 [Gammaproteobacteria bacterium]|nr:hypothetical protein [Gammaproteobacteria bacterium]
MLSTSLKNLLTQWEADARIKADLVSIPVAVTHADAIKIEALAELYTLPKEEITAQLLQVALDGIEEQMPYIPGPKVIRVEEGDEIYEDIGPMPKYLELQQALQEKK